MKPCSATNRVKNFLGVLAGDSSISQIVWYYTELPLEMAKSALHSGADSLRSPTLDRAGTAAEDSA